MDLISGIFVYFVTWWIVLFTILPWGVRQQDSPIEGHATGAPSNPQLKKKFIITSVVTAIIWGIIYILMDMELINFFAEAEQMAKEDNLI